MSTDMGFVVRWDSQKGNGTQQNWDFGGIGFNAQGAFCVLADGTGTRKGSGELAWMLVRELVDRFSALSGVPATPELIVGWIKDCHGPVTSSHPMGSASYSVVHLLEDGTGFVLHAGDCLVATTRPGEILGWLTKPHTLANALPGPTADMAVGEVAKHPARHCLVRSFRRREFMAPEHNAFALGGASTVLMATDGLWAETDFVPPGAGRPAVATGTDDRTLMSITVEPGTRGNKVIAEAGSGQNLYYP